MKSIRHSIALGCIVLVGCLRSPAGPEGYRCDRDEHCGPDLVCLERICQQRPATPPPGTPPSPDNAPEFPWRMARYHGEYPFKWGPSSDRTHFTPSLGKYSALDVLDTHVKAFAHGRLPIALFTWWGPGTNNDEVWKQALQKTADSGLLWIALYAQEPTDHPDSAAITSAIAHLSAQVRDHANYVHRDGLPVLFVAADTVTSPCDVSSRWVSGNDAAGDAKVWLVVQGDFAETYLQCPRQPQAWFIQRSASASLATAGAVAVSPGRWDYADSTPLLARDPVRFRANVRAMVASGANIQLVTSFNNWEEGTAVESAVEWSSPSGFGQYLDILHEELAP